MNARRLGKKMAHDDWVSGAREIREDRLSAVEQTGADVTAYREQIEHERESERRTTASIAKGDQLSAAARDAGIVAPADEELGLCCPFCDFPVAECECDEATIERLMP